MRAGGVRLRSGYALPLSANPRRHPVRLLCALRLLRHIARAARAGPAGLRYAAYSAVLSRVVEHNHNVVTWIADAGSPSSFMPLIMHMRRARREFVWHPAPPAPKDKTRVADTFPATWRPGCVGICRALRKLCDQRHRKRVLNNPRIPWRARDRGPMDPGPMALPRPAVPRRSRAPRWPSVRARMELRRSARHVAHRACAEVAGKTERRSAGRDGKDCGAEQGGGTERQDPNAIGRRLREVVVHGITFEVDCDHPQLPVGDLAWSPRSPVLLAFTWRLRALPPVDSASRACGPAGPSRPAGASAFALRAATDRSARQA